MSVIRNTFTGTLSASPSLATSYQTHTIMGLTSETSTTNLTYMNPEASLHFLNALYKTIVDAGYGDAIKNDDEYSITVLGFKFFVLVSGSREVAVYIFLYGYGSLPNTSGYHINGGNLFTELEYNITVRGDSNHISIYLGTFNSPATEQPLLYISKGKNLVTSSDIYLFGKSITVSPFLMREKNALYNLFYNSSGNPLNIYISYKGLNTNSKFVCVPQLAYYNTCLIYSMIQGNSAVFTHNKYYKIGNEIYYNENGFLYKVG